MATLRLALEATASIEFARVFRAYASRADDGTPTDPIDFTNYSASFIVRERQYASAFEIFRADMNNGYLLNGGTAGTLTVQVPGMVTDVEDGDFFYWLAVWPTASPEHSQCWLHGPFKVLPGPGAF